MSNLANCYPFHLLNMLPNIKPEHLKLTYYCLISIFLDITLKLTHFASFFSSRVFPALEFDSNYFGILLWELVKPREHNEIEPPIGKIFRKCKPIRPGFELTYRDSGNTINFLIFTMQISPPSQKITIPKYNAVSYFEKEKFFSVAIKNNFNMPGVDKSRTCVRYVLEIINFTNCRTWLFSKKYVHEHNVSVTWVILKN